MMTRHCSGKLESKQWPGPALLSLVIVTQVGIVLDLQKYWTGLLGWV